MSNKKKTQLKQLTRYFDSIFRLAAKGEKFPVNLDEVWPLVYARKEEAVRALKDEMIFVENIDYECLRKNAESKSIHGGDKRSVQYKLTLSCTEFFIARKVRAVFNVYRNLFHEVIGQHTRLYYQKQLKNNMVTTIGIKPIAPNKQKDNDKAAIINSLISSIKATKIKSERAIMKERAFVLASEIDNPDKRMDSIYLIRDTY